MKIVSWNVNGIRACANKGFLDFVFDCDPDILCLQETKAHQAIVDKELVQIDGYTSYWSSAATKKGYSGTATYTKKIALNTGYGLGIRKFDNEGRFVVSDHGAFLLYNVYFPNGSASEDRHLFKQEFLHSFLFHLKQKISAGREVIVLGDYNVAHQEIDVYDPVRLSSVSGFLPEERRWFDEFLGAGFVDSFRHIHGDLPEKFSWWSYREKARENNRGWRLDMISVTQGLVDKIRGAEILVDQEGSDHCPVMLELDL